SIAKKNNEDVHLSLTVSLSHKDRQLIRQKIAQFVEEISGQIKGSKEEELMAFNLDFFEV
ncbi:MAG: hypothetical protein KDD34_06240, partial [Bdellovibrionales bacterium]|nr:hypothetical protein [Bdellovibrionales bacterium]